MLHLPLSFLIDVKTKKYLGETNFTNVSEFLIYFPQLIAGPILRAKELIPELKKKYYFQIQILNLEFFIYDRFIKKYFC